MPTEKPSVTTYVDSGLYKQLVALKEKRRARSLSHTVEEILKEYVSGSISSSIFSSLLLEQNSHLIQQINLLLESHQALQENMAKLERIISVKLISSTSISTQTEISCQGSTAKKGIQEFVQENGVIKSFEQEDTKNNSAQSLSTVENGLTGIQLATRLNINSSILSRRRSRHDFSQWSQRLDPDRIAWTYIGFSRRFCPTEISSVENEYFEI